jgi:hypothetical protein
VKAHLRTRFSVPIIPTVLAYGYYFSVMRYFYAEENEKVTSEVTS